MDLTQDMRPCATLAQHLDVPMAIDLATRLLHFLLNGMAIGVFRDHWARSSHGYMAPTIPRTIRTSDMGTRVICFPYSSSAVTGTPRALARRFRTGSEGFFRAPVSSCER